MEPSFRYLRSWLIQVGVLPASRLARAAWYLLGLDLFLFVLQKTLGLFQVAIAASLGGWVTFLSLTVIVLFTIIAFRRLKAKLLWRLRNRLIVTYVFIGVIPVVLLAAMAFITAYLFAGQFANFVVTSDLKSRLQSLEAVNAAIANELAARVEHGQPPTAESLEGLKRHDPAWSRRKICAWSDDKPLPLCGGVTPETLPFARAPSVSPQFGAIVSDHGKLHLRSATTLSFGAQKLTVVSSEPLDRNLLEVIAADLGEITLYVVGIPSKTDVTTSREPIANGKGEGASVNIASNGAVSSSEREALRPIFTAGSLPASRGTFDREITFGTPLPVVNWANGQQQREAALLRVQTRPSVLYARLFAALGDFAKGVELVLLFSAVVFAIIELLALWIGTRLTRTVTGAVAQLYRATEHINRGDFSHRIPVKSSDQLAALANSFNSMTASIEKLIEEQKQKQRLENELAIAQEVQAQLFPQHISQLASLEVYGFCRPARTVSGDYYDFLTVDSDKLLLAVGDISGKGISAALLMATIHSAVRAYSLEGTPILREPMVVGRGGGSDIRLASGSHGGEVSPATLLSLLNHQLYQSTPPEKYATLFLGTYDEKDRKLTYSNGGHLPPIILGEDGTLRRLDCGGTVVGLIERVSYDETSIQMRRGEIFLAYSDGVTEPENDFGEFGERRLIDLVQDNRHLPLTRITEIVTAAVDDWIGDQEQPDDVTLVLARAR
jgi:sigma-B regulation protein RsbU (phosphoserine phosphatase)